MSVSACTVPSSSAENPVPGLRISHLMLFTACSAGYLSIVRDDMHRSVLPPSALLLATYIAHAVCIGPAIASLFLFPYWRRRSVVIPQEPGDHLLLLIGRNEVLLIAMYYLAESTAFSSGFAILALLAWGAFLIGSMWPPFYATNWPLAWRWTFPVWLMTVVASAFEASLVALIGCGLLVIVVGIALSHDLRSQRPLRWTHVYGGVLAVLPQLIRYLVESLGYLDFA